MPTGIRLFVAGEFACFTRQEMKAERVSYDVMTPSAARGILESIYWKPQIRWVPTAIHVLKPIRYQSLRRNELGSKISVTSVRRSMNAGDISGLPIAIEKDRTQRASTVLCDVAYVIEARFEITDKADDPANSAKHLDQFRRRARRGQCFRQPCLGTREFAADFRLLEPDEPIPPTIVDPPRDLGLMLYDIDHANGGASLMFNARLDRGVIRIPPPDSPEIRR